MSHLAHYGRILIGPVPPWDEPEHGDLPDGTLWLDTSSAPPSLRVRTAAARETGAPVGLTAGAVRALIDAETGWVAAETARHRGDIAAIKARLGMA